MPTSQTLKDRPQTTADGSLENVFELRPIILEGFMLHAYRVEPIDTPTLQNWQAAFHLATSTQESSPYWVGDLLLYAESRREWRSKIEQAKAVTGLSHQTLLNQTSVSKHVAEPARKLAPSYSHAAAVASLEAEEQASLLTSARTYGWKVHQLRRAVRRLGRESILEGQAESMHTVDVTVRVVVEAPSSWHAQDLGWKIVKNAIANLPHAHVISASALETIP